MAEGIQIKNLPSTTAIKQGDTMTIVQDKQNKQLSLDVFANESDLATLSVLENRCDEVKAKIEVDEYSAEITTSQSMSEIGSDDNGANLHENVLDGAFESCVLKGKTKYRDIDTGEILEDFEEGRNLELITVRMPILTTFDGGIHLKSDFETGSIYSSNGTNYDNVSNRIRTKRSYPTNGGTKIIFDPNITLQRIVFYYNNSTYVSNSGDWSKYNEFEIPNGVNNFRIVFQASNIESLPNNFHIMTNANKTSILSFNQNNDKTIVLRSLPDGTCDTLNVETEEYVQKIGERNYQDGDTNSNTLVTDGTKTHYKLSSPITTKVDVQGFPHAYKSGHIQLSSGSNEPSLTPTVIYKVPVSRVGQIASNTKSNLRQTIKLDQLEVLAYQSLINAEYENLLVQNSAESAASFTNLSTNDPKDELYYMLKHLIEEDQPVQNMLDKINLFYLYGLLSDEHYFDLLLGGEEDVY